MVLSMFPFLHISEETSGMKCEMRKSGASRWRGLAGRCFLQLVTWFLAGDVGEQEWKLGDDVTSFLYLDIASGMESRGECWEVAQCTQTLGFGHCPVWRESTQGCELVHWLRGGEIQVSGRRMGGEGLGVGGRVVVKSGAHWAGGACDGHWGSQVQEGTAGWKGGARCDGQGRREAD